MKKNVIALLLAVVLASGGVGTVPALAVEVPENETIQNESNPEHETHIWEEEYTIVREATCTEEGSMSIHCSVCDAIDETTVSAIPMKDHAYSDWTVTVDATCTSDGSKERVCADCSNKETETISALGHRWNEEYTVDQEATCTEVGYESIHCAVCDMIDESTIHEIPVNADNHTYGEWHGSRKQRKDLHSLWK